ncbi:MAG: aspartate aminotransferase family protein [Myxococcales bacterium]|nr:aspartate aminotransferase family protein [Myxococcales bacterium]
MVWARGTGANVWDADDNRFVDFTSGFGVALVGHGHPAVVAAATAQTSTLIHASGDAWPDVRRIRLLERLAAFAPGSLSVGLLGLSGSDAVDAAVKTARLATGRPGVLVFEGGYHGLASGVLALQSARPAFAEPFADTLHPAVRRVPWACDVDRVAEALADGTVGLVLLEPIQGRGGVRDAPHGWLADVARATRDAGALLAFDEIQTGMGRTGARFACMHVDVQPDLLCVGKALAGGFPLSACLGTPEAMGSWGDSAGEAIHTQTFLGHPVGCAAALAVLDLLEADLLDRVQERGSALEDRLGPLRGRGLLRAVPLPAGVDALATSRALLQRGYLTLPATADSLQLTPPACISDAQIDGFADALRSVT